MDGVTAPSRTRRRAFALLAVSIPALTFGALEGALRALHYQGDLSLFVRLPYAAGQYMGVNDRVAARYSLNVRMLPPPPTDIFLPATPTHGFRVFVLGVGSTETLGAVPALGRACLRLERRLKTVLLARGLVGGLARWLEGSARGSLSLMRQLVREEWIPLDSPTYR